MNIVKDRGRWRIRQGKNGKNYSISLDHKPSKAEAERLMAELIAKSEVVVDKDMLLIDAIENYCSIKSKVLSPATIRGYHTIKRALPEYLTYKMLSDIDNLTIQRAINDYSVNHSPKSVKNAYGLITAVLSMYCPSFEPRCTLPMIVPKEPYIPTTEEVKRICDEARGTDYWEVIMLGAYGLRRSEIFAIDPATDLDGNVLKISKALVYDDNNNWVIKRTKTAKSTREIVICDELADSLRKKGCVTKAHPSSVFQWMARKEKELGMEHFSLHKLRHHFATVMSTLLPEKDWLYLGGWSSDHIAKTVYQHQQIARNNEAKK